MCELLNVFVCDVILAACSFVSFFSSSFLLLSKCSLNFRKTSSSEFDKS